MSASDGPFDGQDPFDDEDSYRVFSVEDEDTYELDPDSVSEVKPSLAEVLAHLEQGERRFADLLGFSDLDAGGLALLAERWEAIDPALRATVVHEADDIARDNVLLEFSRFFLFASRDEDEAVRLHAVAALGQPLGDDVEARLVDVLERDVSDDVRSRAASSLSAWAELAAMEELEPDIAKRIETTLFRVAEDEAESWHVRRRAAESASVFGPSPRVNDLVQRMYDEDEIGLRASAIFAAGRGNQRDWLPTIIEELGNEDAEIRFEAARAAGYFGDVEALPGLSELAKDDDDIEVRHAAILAIGEIGGKGAIRILTRLAESAPEADLEIIDEALIEASLDSDPLSLDLDP